MDLLSLLCLPRQANRRGPSLHSGRARPGLENLERRELLTLTLWQIGGGAYDLTQTFLLHSNPGARQVVYLDFNGNSTGNVYGSSWDNLTSPAWDYSGNGTAF